MRVNEVKISKVLNELFAIIKKVLKDKKEKKKKYSLKKSINNVLSIFATYEAIYIDKHFASFPIIGFKNMLFL